MGREAAVFWKTEKLVLDALLALPPDNTTVTLCLPELKSADT
jgi:hypothetical protein